MSKVQLRQYQQEAIDSILNEPYGSKLILALAVGLGKEQPHSAKILTPGGFTTMGEVQVGDVVIDGNGEPTKVTATYPQGIKDVYRITFNDESVAECGIDHLWTVREKSDDGSVGDWNDVTLKDIIKKQPLNEELYKFSNKFKFEIPVTKVVGEEKELYIDPYIIGCLIADGYTCGNTTSISCPDIDKEIIDKVDSLLPTDYKTTVNRYPACPQYHLVRRTKFGTRRNGLRAYIAELGLDVKSRQKFIPKSYLYGTSYRQRISLLNGLMDCDGSTRRGRTTYSTASMQLAKDVRELVLSLGGNAELVSYDRSHEGKFIDYVVNINFSKNPFTLERKRKIWKPRVRFVEERWIRKIELVRKEESKCITVSSPTSQYLTNDYIVTHNTFTAAQIAVQLEEKLGRPIKVGFLARQRQLVYQASNYFPNKSVGIEMGKDVSKPDDDVVVATVQSLYRRLDKFPRDHFDLLITDECFTGDVEILTDEGFVRFDELGDQNVAQVHDNLTHSFVEPIRKIKKFYKGGGVMFNGITMTENHNQVVWMNDKFHYSYAKQTDPNKILTINGEVECKSFVSLNDLVYCVTVPTGKIIVKKDDLIIVSGNCQEAKGKQYEETINYFKTAYTVGLSGTPFRMDGKKLTDGLFDKIVYQKNIKWGIQNGYLCDVEAVRCFVDYDLSNVRTSGGDFNITDLEEAMTGSEHAIAEAYYKYSNNKPTLVFATGVKHANDIASLIEGAEVIVGSTPQEERDRIFTAFQEKEIPCIVSVEVMTQGVDLPISTVGIFAKPTKSVGRYQQQVGRILRTHPEKEKALIVDCIGSSSLGLCTAPNLIGINLDKVPEKKLDELEGDLMDMIELAEELSDIPTSWIRNSKAVDLWAKDNNYDTDKVNYFQMPDGRMVVSLPERAKIVIPAPDMLGKVNARDIKGMSKDLHEWGLDAYGDVWDMQRALNAVNANLKRNYGDSSMLWDLKKVRRWGNDPATEKQMKIINRKLKDEAPTNLTKFEASQVLNRIKTK